MNMIETWCVWLLPFFLSFFSKLQWRTQVGLGLVAENKKNFKSLLHQLCKSGNSASLSVIHKLLQNIVENPTEEKYKRIKTSNESLKQKIFDVETAVKALRAVGWVEHGQDSSIWTAPTTLMRSDVMAASEALARSQQQAVSQPAESPTANMSPEVGRRGRLSHAECFLLAGWKQASNC